MAKASLLTDGAHYTEHRLLVDEIALLLRVIYLQVSHRLLMVGYSGAG